MDELQRKHQEVEGDHEHADSRLRLAPGKVDRSSGRRRSRETVAPGAGVRLARGTSSPTDTNSDQRLPEGSIDFAPATFDPVADADADGALLVGLHSWLLQDIDEAKASQPALGTCQGDRPALLPALDLRTSFSCSSVGQARQLIDEARTIIELLAAFEYQASTSPALRQKRPDRSGGFNDRITGLIETPLARDLVERSQSGEARVVVGSRLETGPSVPRYGDAADLFGGLTADDEAAFAHRQRATRLEVHRPSTDQLLLNPQQVSNLHVLHRDFLFGEPMQQPEMMLPADDLRTAFARQLLTTAQRCTSAALGFLGSPLRSENVWDYLDRERANPESRLDRATAAGIRAASSSVERADSTLGVLFQVGHITLTASQVLGGTGQHPSSNLEEVLDGNIGSGVSFDLTPSRNLQLDAMRQPLLSLGPAGLGNYLGGLRALGNPFQPLGTAPTKQLPTPDFTWAQRSLVRICDLAEALTTDAITDELLSELRRVAKARAEERRALRDPETMARRALEQQAGAPTYSTIVVAYEMELQRVMGEAAARGLVRQETVAAWRTLTATMTAMRPQINAGGAVDASLRDQAASAAQALFDSLSDETRGEWDEETIGYGAYAGGGVYRTASNRYTGESRGGAYTLGPASGAGSSLPGLIRSGAWDKALPAYETAIGGAVAWASTTFARAAATTTGKDSDYLQQRSATAAGIAATRSELQTIADKKPTPVQAVFQPDSDICEGHPQIVKGRVVQQNLMLFYWQEDGQWILRDLTRPGHPFEDSTPVSAGETAPPAALFAELDYDEHFTRGTIFYTNPSDASMVRLRIEAGAEASDWLRWAGWILAAAGLVILTAGVGAAVLAGGSITAIGAGFTTSAGYAFGASALAQAASAGSDTWERADHGALDGTTLTLNVLDIVSNLASLGSLAAAKAIAKAGASAATSQLAARLAQLSNAKYVLLGTAMTADGASLAVMTEDTLRQLEDIEKGPGTPDDKRHARLLLISQLVVTGGLTIVSLRSDVSEIAGRKLYVYDDINGRPMVTTDPEVGQPVRVARETEGPAADLGPSERYQQTATPGTVSPEEVAAANQRAISQSRLGGDAPLEEVMVQRTSFPRDTDEAYGQAMAEVVRELDVKLANGELASQEEILEFMSRKTRQVGERTARADADLDDVGTRRAGRWSEPITGMGGRYQKYRPKSQALMETEGGIARVVDEDGIELTGMLGNRWIHTNIDQFPAINAKCDQLLAQLQGAANAGDRLRLIAEYHWYMAHLMPFNRGSAGATDAIVKGLLRRHGFTVGRTSFDVQLDLEAITRPKADFIERYASFYDQADSPTVSGR